MGSVTLRPALLCEAPASHASYKLIIFCVCLLQCSTGSMQDAGVQLCLLVQYFEVDMSQPVLQPEDELVGLLESHERQHCVRSDSQEMRKEACVSMSVFTYDV